MTLPTFSLRKVASTFNNFVKGQAVGGAILILFTLVALIWANSPYASLYRSISEVPIGFHMGLFKASKPFIYWVNDGLMTLFFLLVGLEVKREICIGELSSFKKACFPISAAVFGMFFPAVIFLLININHPENYSGWAIPTATDIAFALGVLSLFRNKIPRNIFALLAAIAIADDIGAVIIISIFYTKHIDLINLFLSALLWVLLWGLNFFRIKRLSLYIILGAFLWYFFSKTGIHPSVTGVLLAATVPLGSHIKWGDEGPSPLQKLENMVNLPVNYIVIPMFILFNAGIAFHSDPVSSEVGRFFNQLFSPLTMGIFFGLLVGKPFGIFFAAFLFKKLGWTVFSKEVLPKHILFMGCLAGIGFTMAIFISDLAFASESFIAPAKIGILLGSLSSVILGCCLLAVLKNRH